MKAGIIGTRGIPNRYGGFEQFAQWLSAGLAERGHDITVYSSHTHPYQQATWNKVNIVHCKDPENRWGTVGQFWYDRNCILDARRRNFDVLLHLGYTSDSIWHRRWPSAAVNIMNMDGMEWKRSKYNWLTRRFLKHAESLAVRNADILISDSPAIQDHIQNSYDKPSAYIPYGAIIFSNPDAAVLNQFSLKANNYFLLIARMEPENNIEMIIKGYIASGSSEPLLIIGNMTNRYGKYLQHRYKTNNIIYAGPVYDQNALNNLRYLSRLYFHGHSVGGTNPSLLEAMACGCTIMAHDNVFNKAVLEEQADYFNTPADIAKRIQAKPEESQLSNRREINRQRIIITYHPEKIITAYEELMLQALSQKKQKAG